MFLEMSVKKLSKVISVELSVISEGLEQSRHLLHSDIIDMVLQFACPKVNAIECALVRLIVGPKGAEGNSSAHMLRAGRIVKFLKVLKD